MEPIREALIGTSLPAALRPALVHTEVIEGARAALIAQQMLYVDRRLIGAAGTAIEVPKATQLVTGDFTDGTTDITSVGSDKTIWNETVTIDKHKYARYSLSKTFLENQPDIDWIRLGFTNMGAAIQEKIDTDILAALIAAVITSHKIDGGQNALDYNEVVSGKTKISAANFKLGFIVVHPNEHDDLIKDSTASFLDVMQYTDPSAAITGEVGRIVNGRVLETTQMTAGSVLFVSDKAHKNGPVAWIAYKRDVTVDEDHDPSKEEMNWFATVRYGVKVTQPSGLALITGVV